MLEYEPPKSPKWGHWVRALSAVQLLERSKRFLREQTDVVPVPVAVPELVPTGFVAIGGLSVSWVGNGSESLPARVKSLQGAFAATPKISGHVGPDGAERREARWGLSAEELAVVASWIDETEGRATELEFSVRCHSHTLFHWKSIPGDNPGSIPWGGAFGVQNFARPRAIMTLFEFTSMEHYKAIKQYLADIELVVLTDKWLRHENPRSAHGRRIR